MIIGKIGRVNNISIELVSGQDIRNNYDIEFTDCKLINNKLLIDKDSISADEIENIIHKKLNNEFKLRIPYIALIHSYNNLNIFLVDGKYVRKNIFKDFTEGGHDLVYNFVPRNEIWIDYYLNTNEIKFVIAHEMCERYLMQYNMEYEMAHRIASKLESKMRKNTKNENLIVQS